MGKWNPDITELILMQKNISSYEIRTGAGVANPDKNMNVLGLNMFNDAVETLEDSIISSNGDVSTLSTRITELEKMLEALISAFEVDETDPTATEILTALIEKLQNRTPFTIREVLE